jgi:anti-anti-sigma factor
MNLTISNKDNVKVIRITGEINLKELGKVENALHDVSDLEQIHIDLTKVTYTNSSFLNIIIMAKDKYPDKKIVILNPNALVMELLNLTGIEQVVEIRYGKLK